MEPLSFEELMLRYYNTLLRLSVQHTGSRAEAEDIVQNTFLKLLESGKAFPDDGHAAYRPPILICAMICPASRFSRV